MMGLVVASSLIRGGYALNNCAFFLGSFNYFEGLITEMGVQIDTQIRDCHKIPTPKPDVEVEFGFDRIMILFALCTSIFVAFFASMYSWCVC